MFICTLGSNTRYSRRLLRYWIPENSQLWTASHSLEFIDYANVPVTTRRLSTSMNSISIKPLDYAAVGEIRAYFRYRGSSRFGAKGISEQEDWFCAKDKDTPQLYNAIDFPDFLFVVARDKNAITIQARAIPDYLRVDRSRLSSARRKSGKFAEGAPIFLFSDTTPSRIISIIRTNLGRDFGPE